MPLYYLLDTEPINECERGFKNPNYLKSGGGGTWVNFCWVFVAGLSEPLPHYSLFCVQL